MIEVEQISSEEWATISENAFKVVFNLLRPKEMDRIDYALVGSDETGLVSYLTARELDKDSVYWQYGGAFPGTHSSIKAYRAYQAFLAWTESRYKRVTTLVENHNVRYLKMAMECGFRIIGVRVFKGDVLVELLLEFKGKGEG